MVKLLALSTLLSVTSDRSYSPYTIVGANNEEGAILWDGRFLATSLSTVTSWSWSNQAGPGSAYKNPAAKDERGLKLTIDFTAKWNSDMWRTELIPQTTAAINKGTVYYHFSVKHTATNSPSANEEHQVCFFESHFSELKFGWINGNAASTPDAMLRWEVGGQSKWSINFTADGTPNCIYPQESYYFDPVWHHIAFEKRLFSAVFTSRADPPQHQSQAPENSSGFDKSFP